MYDLPFSVNPGGSPFTTRRVPSGLRTLSCQVGGGFFGGSGQGVWHPRSASLANLCHTLFMGSSYLQVLTDEVQGTFVHWLAWPYIGQNERTQGGRADAHLAQLDGRGNDDLGLTRGRMNYRVPDQLQV